MPKRPLGKVKTTGNVAVSLILRLLICMFSRLKEDHAAQVKAAAAGTEDQQCRLTHLEDKMRELQEELAAEKEANNSMENLVEDQKMQLARREKHIKAGRLCRSRLAAVPSAARSSRRPC